MMSKAVAVALPVLLCALLGASAASAQHSLNQRMRDVTLGRWRDREMGAAAELRTDWGFVRGENVFRTDVAAVLSLHPLRGYRRDPDFHLGTLLSYTTGGAFRTDDADTRRGALGVRPFVIFPIPLGELILSFGISSLTRACRKGGEQVCIRSIAPLALASVARLADMVELVPADYVLRSSATYNVDYGVLSLRADLGADFVRRSFHGQALDLDDAWVLSHALGLALSLTKGAFFIDHVIAFSDPTLWGRIPGARGPMRVQSRNAQNFDLYNVLAVGGRLLVGRHFQVAVSYKHPFTGVGGRFNFVGVDFELPI